MINVHRLHVVLGIWCWQFVPNLILSKAPPFELRVQEHRAIHLEIKRGDSSMKGVVLVHWVPGAGGKNKKSILIPFLSKQSLDTFY